MPAVHEHSELYRLGSAHFHDALDCRAHRSARIEDVVAQDNISAVDRKGHVRAVDHRVFRDDREVVPIERDVEYAEVRTLAEKFFGIFRDFARKGHAPRADSHERKVLRIALRDFVRDARIRAAHGFCVHQLCLEFHRPSVFGHKKSRTLFGYGTRAARPAARLLFRISLATSLCQP